MTTQRSASGTERLQFHEGAMLRADDLQDDVTYESRMRGLHVRVLHNTWGVARGFGVHRSFARNAVLVGPGIAYDCAGREIVSSRSMVLELPPRPTHEADDVNAWWFDLVIRRDAGEATSSHLDAGCLGDGVGRAEERPRWRWVYAGPTQTAKEPRPPLADDVRLGEEVPIGRISLVDDRTIGVLDLSMRRHAHGLVRPHIASGHVPHGSTTVDGTGFTWSLRIDTSAGGFSQTPFYFATIEDQYLDLIAASATDVETADLIRRLLGPFLSIESPTSSGFTLRVRLGLTNLDFDPEFGFLSTAAIIVQRQQPLPVGINWYGIEPVEGCQPTIALAKLQRLSGQAFVDPEFAFRNVVLRGEAMFTHDGEAGGDE